MENLEATEKGFDENLCFIDFMKLSKNLQISVKRCKIQQNMPLKRSSFHFVTETKFSISV
jgi:hypothetical protein